MSPEEQNAELREQLKTALERIAELEALVKRLRQGEQKWKRGLRTRGCRFSSRREKKKAVEKRKPGRPAGHEGAFRPVPDRVDEQVSYPVPEVCSCGGPVVGTEEVVTAMVEDIPPPSEPIHTEHVAHVGVCTRCGKRVHAPMPGGAKTQVGARATALMLRLRYRHRVPLGQVRRFMKQQYGLSISKGGLSQLGCRRAKHTQAARPEIRQHLLENEVVQADETTMRQQGKMHWMWLLQSPTASLFHMSPSRSAKVFDELMPLGSFSGVLVSDFYGVYVRRKDVLHSYCGAHLIREAKAIAEVDPTPVTIEFSDKLRALYKKGEMAADFESKQKVRATFRWLTTHKRFGKHPDVDRLRKRIAKHFESYMAFVGRDDIPWHNNKTEREIRHACIFRKVTGGTQSERGSNACSHWFSVERTTEKNGIDFDSWIREAFEAVRWRKPLPSVLPQPP